jgi:O-antigen ligase
MIKKIDSLNLTVFAILFLLLCIPLDYAYSNIAMVVLFLVAIFSYKKSSFNVGLLLPVLLYIIMLCSYFCTLDKELTINALLKEISFFIVPLSFFLLGKIEENQFKKLIQYYAYGIVIYCFVFLTIALFKYLKSSNTSVFYYHNLIGKDLNAIHFSVFVSLAFFILLIDENKKIYNYLFLVLLGITLLLLSSKTVIFCFVLLLIIYEVFYSKTAKKLRLRNLIIFGIALFSLFFIGKVKDRFLAEYQANTTKSISHNVVDQSESSVNIISMKEAWSNTSFTANDYFPGSAFRVYQARVFFELMQENKVYFTGFGLGASQEKIEKKTLEYNLYQGDENLEGYQKKNFHNQYFQIFAEIGFFGFLLLIVMILYSFKKSIKCKKYIFFAFISLIMVVFLTESFLWRQRGVLFFITFYCLFHQLNIRKKTLLNNN